MTLSHRWGNLSPLTLTQSTYHMLKEQNPVSALPKTFRDVVATVRSLGARYVWIDSLCIFQDSREDWLKESLKMRNVYAHSMLNIAATAAKNSDEGCFRDRNPSLLRPCITYATWTGIPETQYAVLDNLFWRDNLSTLPLLRRGWVLQERVLAPRILHFGQAQTFWECQVKNACETYPNGVPSSIWNGVNFKELDSLFGRDTRPKPLSPIDRLYPAPGPHDFWNRIVVEYSKCDLTYESDKLVALAGIARQVQLVTGDDYVAGMWKSQFPLSLGWHVERVQDPRVPLARRPSAYRAPSWSWASVNAPILCGYDPKYSGNNGISLITMLDIPTTAIGHSGGPVAAALLTILGILRPASCHNLNRIHGLLKINSAYFHALIKLNCSSQELLNDLSCLPLRHYLFPKKGGKPWITGLLLKAVTENPQTYMRIAHFSPESLEACQILGIEAGDDSDSGTLSARFLDERRKIAIV